MSDWRTIRTNWYADWPVPSGVQTLRLTQLPSIAATPDANGGGVGVPGAGAGVPGEGAGVPGAGTGVPGSGGADGSSSLPPQAAKAAQSISPAKARMRASFFRVAMDMGVRSAWLAMADPFLLSDGRGMGNRTLSRRSSGVHLVTRLARYDVRTNVLAAGAVAFHADRLQTVH